MNLILNWDPITYLLVLYAVVGFFMTVLLIEYMLDRRGMDGWNAGWARYGWKLSIALVVLWIVWLPFDLIYLPISLTIEHRENRRKK